MKQWFALLLLLAGTAHAAVLQGSIYDNALNRVENAIVEVNTTPRQRVLAANGTYRFALTPGNYQLLGYYQDQRGVLRTVENISIAEDGDYYRDLFLYPTLEEEQQLYDLEFEIDPPYSGTSLISFLLPVAVLLLVLLLLLVKFDFSLKKKTEKLDNDLQAIVDLLHEHGGRMKQKHLRSQLAHSEAKVSLMLTELEEKGTIKKIKKGRGNIIILED